MVLFWAGNYGKNYAHVLCELLYFPWRTRKRLGEDAWRGKGKASWTVFIWLRGLTFSKNHPQRLFMGIADRISMLFWILADSNNKELERMLKVSEIKMSVDKVLALAKTITTIQIKLPLNKEVCTQTMLMARHQKIAKLFDEDFWVTRWRSLE